MSLKFVLYSLFILSTTLLRSQAAYTCDSTTCVHPQCFCASTTPPGNIPIDQVPQFFVISFDDAMQQQTMQSKKTRERWRDGEMDRWIDGETWRDGEMERLREIEQVILCY